MGAFAFQTGDWQVHHRKLTTRLEGADDWVEFAGTCRAWEVMDGAGNVEDQFLDDPSGPYRASALRRCSPGTDTWSIWWFDGRFDAVDPPSRAVSKTVSAAFTRRTLSRAARFAFALSGPGLNRTAPNGSRPSRWTTARHGRSTGS